MNNTRKGRKVISLILTFAMVFSLFIGMGITSNADPQVTTRTIALDLQGFNPITDTNGDAIQPDAQGVYNCPSEGWSYDKENGILTLNNADFRPARHQNAIIAFGNLEINMNGVSTFQPVHTTIAIYNPYDITFTGEGTLNILNNADDNQNNMFYGILARNTVITGGKLNVECFAKLAGGVEYSGIAVYCCSYGSLYITGGELNATAVTSAVRCQGAGDIFISAVEASGSTKYKAAASELSAVHAGTASSERNVCMGAEAPEGGDKKADIAKTVKLKYTKSLKLDGKFVPFTRPVDGSEYETQNVPVIMTGFDVWNCDIRTYVKDAKGVTHNDIGAELVKNSVLAGNRPALSVAPSKETLPGSYFVNTYVTQDGANEMLSAGIVVNKWTWTGTTAGIIPLPENTASNGEIELKMLSGVYDVGDMYLSTIMKVEETEDPDNILTITTTPTVDPDTGAPGNDFTYDVISTPGPKAAKAKVFLGSNNYNTFEYEITFSVGAKTPVDITGVDVYWMYKDNPYTYMINPVKPVGTAKCTARTVGKEDVTTECGDLVYTYYSNSGTKEDPVWGAGTTTVPVNAGSYKLVISVADNNEKYYGNSDDILFNIDPAEAVIIPKSYEINVGDPVPDFALEATWTKKGETLNIETDVEPILSLATYDDDKTTVDKATVNQSTGKYYIIWSNKAAVTVTLKDGTGKAANYKPVNYKGDVSTLTVVDKDPVTISNVTISGKPYDDTAVAPDGTPVCTKTEGGDDVTSDCTNLTYTYYKNNGTPEAPWDAGTLTAPKDAGKYKLIVAVPSSNEKYSGKCEIPFEITKLNATVKPKNVSYKIGDAADPKLELEWSGLFGTENLGVQTAPAFELKNSSNEVVSLAQAKATEGIYTITWSNMGTPVFTDATGKAINYNVTPSATGTLTVVDKTAVTISGLEIKDKTYDAKAIVPVGTAVAKLTAAPNNDVTSECGTLEYKYFRNTGTTEEPVWSSGSETAPKDAGSYKLVVSVGQENELYAGNGEFKFTINQAAATVKVKDAKAKVGDTEAPTFGLEWGGLVGTETLGLVADPTFELKNSGNEVVTPAQAIATEGSYTITWTNMNAVVFKDGAGVTSNYMITPTGTATLTVVDKAPVTISGINISNKTYDGSAVAPAGTAAVKLTAAPKTDVTSECGTLEYKYFRNTGTTEEPVWSSGSETAPKDAGSYKLVIAVADSIEAYIGKVEIPFTINKAAATVKVKNASVKAHNPIPALELEWSGLVGTETLGVTPAPQFALTDSTGAAITPEDASENGGVFTITWSNEAASSFTDGTGKAANYNVTAATGTLTVIVKTDVTISGISVADKVQDTTAVAPVGTVAVAVKENGAPVTDYGTSLEYTYYLKDGVTKTTAQNSGAAADGAAPVLAGNYKLIISVAEANPTYMGASEPIEFKILVPMQEEKNNVLSNSAISFQFEKPEGDKVVVIGHGTGMKAEDVGEVTITASGVGAIPVTLTKGTQYTKETTESVSITLKEDYLKTLADDDYTLKAEIISGQCEGMTPQIAMEVYKRSSGGGGGSTSFFTLSFDVNGGTTINTVSKATGSTVKLDAFAPTKEGYVFDGWYTDKGLTTKAETVKITADTIVYAGWKAEGEVADGSCKHDSSCVAYKFGDLDLSKWYHDGIHYCVENGLMNGTTGTTFAPNLNTTRGMIVTILYRMEKSPEVTGDCPFEDVKAGAYYEDAITWAAENKIVTGYDSDTFGPEDSITREQMAAIMYRYAEFKGYDVTGKADLSKYADSNAISAYAETAMSWANANALIKGKDGNVLDPTNNAIRCEAAAILQRFCEGLVK